MMNIFYQEEKKNEGFNSLEMLMIKALFDDIFENNVKAGYKEGRNEVVDFLSNIDKNFNKSKSDDNIINLLSFLDDRY